MYFRRLATIYQHLGRRRDEAAVWLSGPGASRAVTDELRTEGQRAVRATVEDIADFDKFGPPQ